MKLTVLGSSAGTPTRTNPASGYLLEHDGSTMWIDAGTGTFMRLAERVDPGQLDAVVISHVHVDHASDLFGLYGYLAYGPSGHVPIPVFVTEGATELFGNFAGATGEHVFHHVLDFREVGRGDTAEVGSFALRFGASKHAVANNITRIVAGGKTLVYTGDAGPSDELAEMADGAALFLCEATLIGERHAQTYPFHLTASEAGQIAARANVGHLVLTHISHTVNPAQSVAEAAERFDGLISYAAPGTEFDI
ncbi:MAG: MBL fold metallo-hydrolase [Acidimicrobiia bacterium]|nr:MBL fold metallo-hydrolase [Acidimicrobiia bacterium]